MQEQRQDVMNTVRLFKMLIFNPCASPFTLKTCTHMHKCPGCVCVCAREGQEVAAHLSRAWEIRQSSVLWVWPQPVHIQAHGEGLPRGCVGKTQQPYPKCSDVIFYLKLFFFLFMLDQFTQRQEKLPNLLRCTLCSLLSKLEYNQADFEAGSPLRMIARGFLSLDWS